MAGRWLRLGGYEDDSYSRGITHEELKVFKETGQLPEVGSLSSESFDHERAPTKDRGWAARNYTEDRYFATPLARLVADGKITQQQYLVGQRVHAVFHKYLETIAAPNPNAAGADPISGGPTSPGVLEMPSDRECEKRTREYREMYGILETVSPQVRNSTINIAVYESPPVDDWDLENLKVGLSALL